MFLVFSLGTHALGLARDIEPCQQNFISKPASALTEKVTLRRKTLTFFTGVYFLDTPSDFPKGKVFFGDVHVTIEFAKQT